jgi:RNA polymerase sigma-70 factor (ECF subfamily)
MSDNEATLTGAEVFLALLGDGSPDEELTRAYVAATQRARTAWPTVHVSDVAWARQLALRVPRESNLGVSLEAMPIEDCYLAVACGAGDPAACALLDRKYFPSASAALQRLGLTPSEQDEALQELRTQLLSAEPGAVPKIMNYQGRGSLKGWLRAVAVRIAMRAVKKGRRYVELHEVSLVGRDDPELACLKETYHGVFQEALARSLASMSREERLLLQRRFAHGLNCDELGALYGVHRATASRMVNDLRRKLIDALRIAVMGQLDVGRGEFSTLLRLVRSELHVALSAAMSPTETSETG